MLIYKVCQSPHSSFICLAEKGGEGVGFYGIESRANIRKLDIYEGTEEGFTGVSEVL